MRAGRIGLPMMLPALVFLCGFLVYPVLSTAINSLYHDSPVTGREYCGLDNYGRLLQDEQALRTVEFTFIFALSSVALEMVAGVLIALAINRVITGKGFIRAAVILPWAVPTVVAAVMWKYVFNDQYGILNYALFGDSLEMYRAWLARPVTARLAIIAADVWKASSFVALIALAGLQSVPRELLEAARIDGAKAVKRFFFVTLPLIRPALLVALLFRVMDAFRVFDLVYVMTQGAPAEKTSVMQYFGYLKMFPEQQYGYGSAVSVLVFLVIALLSVALVRTMGRRAVAK
ncbi:ABC transporter permease subunit [Candidatus Fermentibacteria bacterium]|nr:ABC transporter permease subunit [Candidatus Fermentibacteria bacterium]